MSRSISKLKQKKYITGIIIVVILLGLIGLFSYGKIDKYKGLVKVNKVKLLSSVVNTTNVTSKGTEEISYDLTYTLDEVEGIDKRDVIIKGKLNSPYARFKKINKSNITSTLINDGQEIEIKIEDVRLGEEQSLGIKIQVLNAPNNESIVPTIEIKESTGEYTRVVGEEIKVETNSVEGIVLDENNIEVGNIELSINKDGREIKRTYTDENGRYVFSDLEAGTYKIEVEEEIYEIVSGGNTEESNPQNIIKVKEVDKFNIETHKYIEKLDLVINGKKERYTYKDAEKVVQAIKNAKEISGEIEYKIVVRNKGEKDTAIERVTDEPGEGLEFKESKNTGWKIETGILKYKPIEEAVLTSGEKREIKLVLDITSTKEIKTYINKLNTKGEIKEKIVFIINGEKYREISVTEGDIIEKPNFGIEDLDGWYTDSNYTNKYKFSNRVNKDIILYAKTKEEERKYQVRYIDKNNVVKEEVEDGNKTVAPSDPSKEGYRFNCWKKGDECYNFENEVHSDIDLISDYIIETYQIEYNLDGGVVEEDNPTSYTVITPVFTLNNPSKTGYTFIGWTGSNGTNSEISVSLPDETLENKTYTANYSINKYNVEFYNMKSNGEYELTKTVEDIEYNTSIPSNKIPEVTLRGYTFKYWSKDKTTKFDLSTPITENTKLYAVYEKNTYRITYDLDGGSLTEENPDTYQVDTEVFTLNNPSKEGYTFTGWTGSNGTNPEISVSLPEEELGDKNYKAKYRINKYQLVIDPKGGTYEGELLVEEDFGTIVTIKTPNKTGYNFTGWTLTGSGLYNDQSKLYTFGEGNGKLEANYEPIEYEIEYTGITEEERTGLNNPTSYTIETNSFTLRNPSNRLNQDNEGEVFAGWKEENETTPSISITLPDTNNLGNKKYKAIWQEREADKWNITYNLNGGTLEESNPSTYKRSELPITLKNPKKTGYEFTGWTGSNGEVPSNVTIPVGTEGDLSYTANYNVKNYPIEYDYTSCNLTEEEIIALNNKGSYTVEDDDFNLNNPNKYGYVFKGWTGTDLSDKTLLVTVTTNKAKALSYVANCDLEKYQVEFYNMKSDGTYLIESTVENIGYNTSIPSNKIPEVTLRGYTFKYWSKDKTTEFDLSTPITENTKLYAVYEKNTYRITYDLDGGSLTEENPDTYQIDTEVFTLNNPSKTGYTFIGWTGSNGTNPEISVSLPDETLENKTYTANYSINKYNVEFYNMKSDGTYLTESTVENIEYNTSIPSDKIPEVTLRGYTFKYWSKDKINEYNLNTPITENTKLYAVYEKNTYRITYDLDGGSLTEENPDIYQVDTEEFTLNNPSKEGYEFTGWTGSNGTSPLKVITLPDETLEDKTYTANYSINKYRVTYMDGAEEFDHEEVNHNGKATAPANEPTKAHNIFLGWKLNDDYYNFNLPVTSDLTLYASWEEVEAPEITHSPTTWVRDKVLVTITSEHNDYTYMYKVGSGDYQEYTEAFEVDENTTIYAYSIKNGITSVEASHEITNIDKINPSITSLENTSVSPTSITINAKGIDNESGTDKFKVYVDNELVFESTSYVTNLNEEKELEYTITNLEEVSTYTIKVEIIDKVGNISYEEIEVTTTPKRYVAQIIGTNGSLFNDESMYIKLETLKEAIEYTSSDVNCVTNQCTIQMIEDIEETNSVLDGQDITLDLNGKIITGKTDKAFENNGKFQVVDHKEDEVGKIYSDGTGIVNTGILIIGEEEEPLVVSKTEPIIEGSVYGINNTGTFNFFDGKIIGDSSSGAIRGPITLTPYKHNASVETSGGKEISTLEELADAEARINSVYYTKVQNAVDDAKNGKYENIVSKISSQVKSNTDYRFIYDSVNNTLVNDNQGVANSLSSGYIYFDTREEENDKIVTIDSSISSESGDAAYIIVTNSSDTPGNNYYETSPSIVTLTNENDTLNYNLTNGRILYLSGEKDSTVSAYLEKGKEYYIHFGYQKNGSGDSGSDSFTINSITYSDFNSSTTTPLTNVTDKVIHSNDGSANYVKSGEAYYYSVSYGTEAKNYMVFDLTNVTEPVSLDINYTTYLERYTASAFSIFVRDNDTAPSYNETEGRYLYANRSNSTSDVSIPLTPGQVNYVHFVFHTYWGNQYTYVYLNSLKLRYTNNPEIPSDIYTNQTTEKVGKEIVLNQDVDTVQIIRNITMTNPLEIIETKDVILDLNGYTLTSAKEDYVINNEGSLKITDTDYIGQPAAAQAKYEKELQEYNDQLRRYYEYEESNTRIVNNGFEYRYDYSGDYQSFTAPYTGTYKIEAWGAQGGTSGLEGGKGAYTSGTIELTQGDTLYIYVGGQPENLPRQLGGYNGGGNVSPNDDGTGRAGGGSTDIRLVSGEWNDDESLNSRIMVAAGGGGSACESSSWCSVGGAGGTLTGLAPYYSSASAAPYVGLGGTQTEGGLYLTEFSTRPSGLSSLGTFGKGGDSGSIDDSAAGGSGYYGGGGSSYASGGGGGSSYISGYEGAVAITSSSDRTPKAGCSDGTTDITCSYHYSNIIFNNTLMQSGEDSIPTHDGSDTMTGNSGNGYAKITIIDQEIIDQIEELAAAEDVSPTDLPTEEPVLDTEYTLTGNITSSTYSVIYNGYNGYLDFDTGIININKSGSYSGINNQGTLTLGNNSYINGLQSSNRGIYNNTRGDLLAGTGNINMTGSSSIGIYNISNVDDDFDGYNLSVSNSNSYHLLNESNNDYTINNMNTTGAGIDIYHNSTANLVVNNSTLGSIGNDSFYSGGSDDQSHVEFNECTIKNRVYNKEGSYRVIDINDSTMTGSRENVYNYHGTINIKNSNLNNSSHNVENYAGTINIIDSDLTSDYNNVFNSYYQNISEASSNTINITDSTLTSNQYNIINYQDTVVVKDSTLNTDDTALYNGNYFYWNNIPLPANTTLNNVDINKKGTTDSTLITNVLGNILINGGTVTNESNNSTVINNYANANTTIKGEYSNGDNFTRGVYNSGILTIGEADSTVSKEYPLIRGTGNTVYNATSGTYNYYDGKIIGEVNNGIDGPITEIPVNYDLEVTKGSTLETIVLSLPSEVASENYVSRIGSTRYPTIQSAVDAVPATGTETEIVLLRNVDTATIVNIPSTKNVKLDYDGNTIKAYYKVKYLENEGILTLVDSQTAVNNKSYSNTFFDNSGKINYNEIYSTPIRDGLVLTNRKNATFTITGGEIYSYLSRIIDNSGYLNMSNGKLYTTYSSWRGTGTEINLINNNETGEINFTGGEILFIGKGSVIYNLNKVTANNLTVNLYGWNRSDYNAFTTFITNASENGIVSITGGTYGSSNNRGTVLDNAGTATITNVTSSLGGGVFNSGTATINNSTFSNIFSVYYYGFTGFSNSGKMYLKKLTLSGDIDQTKLISNTGTMEITDSTITPNNGGKVMIDLSGGSLTITDSTLTQCNYGRNIIESTNESILNITGSTLNHNNISSYSGNKYEFAGLLLKNSGAVKITNTDIDTTYSSIHKTGSGTLDINGGSLTSKNDEGLYNNSTGVITIGTLGGVPSKTKPAITGKTYGINNANNGEINFYDGIISGTEAIHGSINEIEPDYEIVLEVDGTIEHKYLDKLPVVKNVRTGEEFLTFDEAFADVNFVNGDTLLVMREVTQLPTASTITIPSTMNVKLDLNGYKIIQNNTNFIINNGTLQVLSSEDGGQIESNASEIFINNGTLTIDNGTYNTTTINKIITNNENSILNINDGLYYDTERTLIENKGQMNVFGGEFKSTRSGNDNSNSYNLIENSGVLNVSDAIFMHSGIGSVINNSGIVVSIDVKVDLRGYLTSNGNGQYGYTVYITNATGSSDATINGGDYGEEYAYGFMAHNNGILKIENVISKLRGTVENSDTGDAKLINYSSRFIAKNSENTAYHGFAAIYNRGTMEISGGNYKGYGEIDNKTLLYNSGDITIDGSLFEYTSNLGNTITLVGSSTATINNSEINSSSSSQGYGSLRIMDESSASIDSSVFNNDNDFYSLNGIHSGTIIHESTETVDISNSELSSVYGNGLSKTNSGSLNITDSIITSTNGIGLYNTGSGTIDIGTLGGTVSNVTPKISGKTYGLNNSSSISVINFYDGIFTAEIPIYGTITDVEPTYEIIQRNNGDSTYSKYLDKVKLVRNSRTNKEFFTIQDAISDSNFNNGDTLEILRDLTTLPSYSVTTIPSGVSVTVDMAGNNISQSNSKLFINNGTLNITDSSQTPGTIETQSGTMIENNGIMNVNNINLKTNVSLNDLIINNLGGDMTLNVNMSSPNNRLITNNGTLTISGGDYRKVNTSIGPSASEDLIINGTTGTLSIQSGTFRNRGDSVSTIHNSNILTITGGTFTEDGYRHETSTAWQERSISITNAASGTANISNAIFQEGDYGGITIQNTGTATLTGITSNERIPTNNYGTLTIDNCTINMSNYMQTYSGSTMNITGGTLTSSNSDLLVAHGNSIVNLTSTTLTNSAGRVLIAYDTADVTVNGGTYSSTIITSSGSGLFEFAGSSKGEFNNATLTGGKMKAISFSSSNSLDINGGITSSETYAVVISSGIGNIKNANINSSASDSVYISGTSAEVNIDNSTITSEAANGINFVNGTLTIGNAGGVPDLTTPVITGKTYGLYKTNNSSNFYFYDGVIKGETDSIYGTITDVEPGYKEKRDSVTDSVSGVTTMDSTLTVIGSTERVAVVNSINFLSLQSAINYASNNSIQNIQLYKNVTLEDNLVLPAGGSNVSIYLGVYTITQGSYTIDSGITLEQGTYPGASLSRFLANISGQEINPKNIVIFEMDDGSKLKAETNYKLYKEMDRQNKLVKVKENSIGNYDLGNENEIIRTVDGKVYINGIGEGTYKLVGTDSKEITFTISYTGVSSNIRENNKVIKNRTVGTIATLILQLQTGVARNPYILLVMFIIVLILGLITYQKYKREE